MTTTTQSIESKNLLKYSREASYYESLTGNRTRCNLCPNACILSEGGRGICGNKINIGGKLYTTAYGNPCASHFDPIEKKPLFHFLPQSPIFSIAVSGCNLKCLNCQNWTISQSSPESIDHQNIEPFEVIDICKRKNVNAIAYTYTEPTAYFEYALETARLAKLSGIRNVLISNGYINKEPLTELCKYVDAASINLKGFKESIYQELNSGSLQPVLDTLLTINEQGIWLEIINLVIPGWTDDMSMIRKMCTWLIINGFSETPLHFSRFTPMYKLSHLNHTPVFLLEEARDAAMNAGMKFVYIGNVSGHEAESTFCPVCSQKLISRRGFSVFENFIINGKCNICSTLIPGIWE